MASTLHLEWELPEGVVNEAMQRELLRVVKQETALRLFAEGKVSSGYAAHLLGVPRLEFLQLLEQRGIPFLSCTADDLREDRMAVERLLQKQSSRTGTGE